MHVPGLVIGELQVPDPTSPKKRRWCGKVHFKPTVPRQLSSYWYSRVVWREGEDVNLINLNYRSTFKHLQAPLLPPPPMPSSLHFFGIRESLPLEQILHPRKKLHGVRLGEKAGSGSSEGDVLTGNLALGETCGPALYRDGSPTTWSSRRRKVLNAHNHELHACATHT
ncbi:hypothetical protein AVEN_267722-1 [Araneus ventricosus]|uniref:Uncharacterized protein n=1 Tax=Araneus ventricosus TaxID=182803 RepID=A0A4Y2CYV2_ARAVE|nr:hypothetical protein AVEN_267722-1 [Araneus ventricosus]